MSAPRLLDALKQYIADAKPGGALNPEVTGQGILDTAAAATTPVPFVGDAIGLAADVSRYVNEPEERTPLNYGLTALGALPFVPAAGITKKVVDLVGAREAKELKSFHSSLRDKIEEMARFLAEASNSGAFKFDSGDKVMLNGRRYEIIQRMPLRNPKSMQDTANVGYSPGYRARGEDGSTFDIRQVPGMELMGIKSSK